MANKAQLIEGVASKTGLTKKDATAAVDAVFGSIQDTLKKGDKVTVKVLEFDFESERLSLSIKELLEKPVKEEVKEEVEYDTSYLKDEDTSFSLGDKFKDIEL